MTDIKITIPGTLPDLNTEINNAKKKGVFYRNGKKHEIPGLLYAQFKKKWTTIVKLETLSQCKGIALKDKINLEITWYAKDKRKDPDNIYFAVKYLLDGFVKAGLIQGDGWRHIGEITHIPKIDRNNPRVEVLVTNGT